MKRICKSKIGFTLLEMVIVVAIIVILAGVLVISIGSFISNAKSKSSTADSERAEAEENIRTEESRMVELGFSAAGSSVRVVDPSSSTPETT